MAFDNYDLNVYREHDEVMARKYPNNTRLVWDDDLDRWTEVEVDTGSIQGQPDTSILGQFEEAVSNPERVNPFKLDHGFDEHGVYVAPVEPPTNPVPEPFRIKFPGGFTYNQQVAVGYDVIEVPITIDELVIETDVPDRVQQAILLAFHKAAAEAVKAKLGVM